MCCKTVRYPTYEPLQVLSPEFRPLLVSHLMHLTDVRDANSPRVCRPESQNVSSRPVGRVPDIIRD